MSDDGRKPNLVESLKSFQGAVRQSGPAAMAAYSLVGAVLLLGAAGYGLDRWLGTEPWGVLGGLLLGVAVGFYELITMSSRRNR
jgi:F0F1-type ATP synthase assembly protein I